MYFLTLLMSLRGGCSIHWPQRMVEIEFGVWDLWLSFSFFYYLDLFSHVALIWTGGVSLFLMEERIDGPGFWALFGRTKVRGFHYTFITLRLSPRTKTAKGMSWESFRRRYWRNKVRGFHYSSFTTNTNNNNKRKSVGVTWALFRRKISEGKVRGFHCTSSTSTNTNSAKKQEGWWLGHCLGGRILED